MKRALFGRARRREHQAGAAVVEYGLLLFAVLICSAVAIKRIGPQVGCAALDATGSLVGGSGGACGGATASATGGTGGGGSSGNSAGSGGTGGGSSNAGSGGSEGSGEESSGGYIASASSFDDGAGGLMGAPGLMGGGGGRGMVAMSVGGGSLGGGNDEGSPSDDSFAAQVAGTTPQQEDLTFAKLSSISDGANRPTKGAGGFRPLTDAELAAAGITPSMLQDDKSGFAATVFTNGKGDYVVAYRGTQFDGSLPGPGTDVMQGAGLSTMQFAEGARLGKAAKNAFGNDVVFTGHSLGGALASSSAALTGLPAVTFNAAGVHDHTLLRDGVDPATERAQADNGQVRNYEVKGEILSTLQERNSAVMPQALGRKIQIADPDPAATKAAAEQSNPFNLYWPTLMRRGELHGDFVQGMKAGPVKYEDSAGKTQEYSFTDPPHS